MGNDQSRQGGGGGAQGSSQSSSPGGGGGSSGGGGSAPATQQQQQQRAAILAPRAPRDPLYHMKLVVRGKRGVGKSSLLARLRGQAFSLAYEASPEIQTASIAWQYKNMDDKIEVEVWDVVDRARAAGQASGGGGGEEDDDAPAGAWPT